MAKVVAEFNTKTKELVVKMNGEVLPDISSACFYTDYLDSSKGYIELSKSEHNEGEGMSTHTRIYANQEEFVEVDQKENLRKQVAKLLHPNCGVE